MSLSAGWRVAHYGGGILLAAFAVAFLVWQPFRPVGARMTDFSAYYAAGRIWSHGGDPYSRTIWTVEKTIPGVNPRRREMLPFVGPPLGLPLWAALGALPYALAAAIWGVVLTACIAVLMIVPARLAGREIRAPTLVSLVLLALTAGPLVTGISVGQAALPACAAIVVAVACAATRRWTWMACATVVAALLKPNDALVIAAVGASPAAIVAACAAAALSLVANVPFAGGLRGLATYVDVVAHQSSSERFFTYQMTPTSIAYGFGLSAAGAEIAGTLVAIAAFAAIVVAVRRRHASAIDAAAIVCALFPFVVPFEHEPDLAIVFFPALLVVFRARGWAWALGATGAALLCIDPFALAQGRLGAAFTVVMSSVAALQLAALAPRGMGRMRLAPLAVLPLVVLAGLAAPTSRLPMWPAALPEHVAVAADATAGAEWHDEIAASGLERRRPWAALVRSITLAGCACIAVAAIGTGTKRRLVALPAPAERADEAA